MYESITVPNSVATIVSNESKETYIMIVGDFEGTVNYQRTWRSIEDCYDADMEPFCRLLSIQSPSSSIHL